MDPCLASQTRDKFFFSLVTLKRNCRKRGIKGVQTWSFNCANPRSVSLGLGSLYVTGLHCTLFLDPLWTNRPNSHCEGHPTRLLILQAQLDSPSQLLSNPRLLTTQPSDFLSWAHDRPAVLQSEIKLARMVLE